MTERVEDMEREGGAVVLGRREEKRKRRSECGFVKKKTCKDAKK